MEAARPDHDPAPDSPISPRKPLANLAREVWQPAPAARTRAQEGKPREWRGKVLTADRRPVTGARLSYLFESNRGKPVDIVSDVQGRYCLRWPEERISARVSVASGSGATLIVSPDAAESSSILEAKPPLRVAATPWDPQRDAAARCSEGAPPWDRVDGASGNWRYKLLQWASVLTLAIGVGTGILAGVGVLPARLRARAWLVPAVLAGCDVVMFVLIWVVHAV